MANALTALIEPRLLTWARISANLEPLAAARRIGVDESELLAWETGAALPSIAQARRAAEVYRRSLGVFFLSEPPANFETMRDYRRLAGSEKSEWSISLQAEFRRAEYQRDVMIEMANLVRLDGGPRWPLSKTSDSDHSLAREARAQLIEHCPMSLPSKSGDSFAHLRFWITAVETLGVLVLQTSRGLVEVDEMKGFSLHQEEFPVIVLNGKDFARSRLFTLVHEFAHLSLRSAGLCDVKTDQRPISENRRLEARCNAIAAEILMPRGLVIGSADLAEATSYQPSMLPQLIHLAAPFGVSVEALLRRLQTLGMTTQQLYPSYRKYQESNPPPARKKSKGEFYRTKARDMGRGYVRLVGGARERDLLDAATAATYLDVKVEQIPRLYKTAQL